MLTTTSKNPASKGNDRTARPRPGRRGPRRARRLRRRERRSARARAPLAGARGVRAAIDLGSRRRAAGAPARGPRRRQPPNRATGRARGGPSPPTRARGRRSSGAQRSLGRPASPAVPRACRSRALGQRLGEPGASGPPAERALIRAFGGVPFFRASQRISSLRDGDCTRPRNAPSASRAPSSDFPRAPEEARGSAPRRCCAALDARRCSRVEESTWQRSLRRTS